MEQHCVGILSSKCCPNTSETNWSRKKYLWAMLAQSAQIYFRRKTGCFKYVWQAIFNRVLYHWTILALFVQCWLGSSFTACGTTMNRSRLWLDQLHKYHGYDIDMNIRQNSESLYIIFLNLYKFHDQMYVWTIQKNVFIMFLQTSFCCIRTPPLKKPQIGIKLYWIYPHGFSERCYERFNVKS